MKNKPFLPDVTFSELDGVRCLHLETPWVQGTMKIKQPYEIELEYVQRMMAWLLWVSVTSLPERLALQLGLGAASITKFCYKTLAMKTMAIEINPKVIAACRQHFRLPPDSHRLSVVLADASEEVRKPAMLATVDALAVDLYDHEAAAPVLDSQDFYADCYKLLTHDGVMAVNLFGRHHSFYNSLNKIKAVFGENCVRAFKPTREGNTVVLAFRSEPQIDSALLLQRAESIQSRFGLPAKKWLRLLQIPA